MATLEELATAGELVLVRVRLARHEYEDRKFYAVPGFLTWLRNDVMKAQAFYPENISPRQQASAILKLFISGKPFSGTGMFKRLSPSSDDVWEMRTPDLRFFGWVPKKDAFLAVRGDLFENLKNDQSLYEKHRIETKEVRQSIGLDEPKYLKGASEYDIVSD